MQDMLVTPARRLLHQPVRNFQGLHLGEIEELVIELDRGFIAYAVLAHGTSTGTGRKRFAIPWSAFCVDPDGSSLRLNLQPEVLHAAPGLAYEDEPSLAPSAASAASV